MDSLLARGISLFVKARYKLVQLSIRIQISVAVAFPLVRFRRFFRSLLGLINHLYPYAVKKSYLVRGELR
jgi:hypothetical protein